MFPSQSDLEEVRNEIQKMVDDETVTLEDVAAALLDVLDEVEALKWGGRR